MNCPFAKLACEYFEVAGGNVKICGTCTHYKTAQKKVSQTAKVVFSVTLLLILVPAIFYAAAEESLTILTCLGIALLWDACWFIDLTFKKEL